MKVICSSEESLYRPEAVRWRQRMEIMKLMMKEMEDVILWQMVYSH